MKRFESKGYKLVAIKILVPSRELAERHYEEHAGKYVIPILILMPKNFAVSEDWGVEISLLLQKTSCWWWSWWIPTKNVLKTVYIPFSYDTWKPTPKSCHKNATTCYHLFSVFWRDLPTSMFAFWNILVHSVSMDRPFYPGLVDFLSSGAVLAMVRVITSWLLLLLQRRACVFCRWTNAKPRWPNLLFIPLRFIHCACYFPFIKKVGNIGNNEIGLEAQVPMFVGETWTVSFGNSSNIAI